MPTLVGHYSLPLFECFYFKIPVFFTKNLLDESLKKYVYEITVTVMDKPNNILNKSKIFKKIKETQNIDTFCEIISK